MWLTTLWRNLVPIIRTEGEGYTFIQSANKLNSAIARKATILNVRIESSNVAVPVGQCSTDIQKQLCPETRYRPILTKLHILSVIDGPVKQNSRVHRSGAVQKIFGIQHLRFHF